MTEEELFDYLFTNLRIQIDEKGSGNGGRTRTIVTLLLKDPNTRDLIEIGNDSFERPS